MDEGCIVKQGEEGKKKQLGGGVVDSTTDKIIREGGRKRSG